MPVTRDPAEAGRPPDLSGSGDEGAGGTDRSPPALEGPPPRDVILLDSIPVGPGQVVDIIVPRDRSVPPPDEIIDPFEPAASSPDGDTDRPADVLADGEVSAGTGRKRRRFRFFDLWRRLLRLLRASSRPN